MKKNDYKKMIEEAVKNKSKKERDLALKLIPVDLTHKEYLATIYCRYFKSDLEKYFKKKFRNFFDRGYSDNQLQSDVNYAIAQSFKLFDPNKVFNEASTVCYFFNVYIREQAKRNVLRNNRQNTMKESVDAVMNHSYSSGSVSVSQGDFDIVKSEANEDKTITDDYFDETEEILNYLATGDETYLERYSFHQGQIIKRYRQAIEFDLKSLSKDWSKVAKAIRGMRDGTFPTMREATNQLNISTWTIIRAIRMVNANFLHLNPESQRFNSEKYRSIFCGAVEEEPVYSVAYGNYEAA